MQKETGAFELNLVVNKKKYIFAADKLIKRMTNTLNRKLLAPERIGLSCRLVTVLNTYSIGGLYIIK